MKCIAVDDEPLALEQLASYIKKVPGLELVEKCSSAIQALEIIKKGGIDLLFSDISMPDMSGMELVKQIGGQCLVIFTTAYDQYAIEGYKVDAVDYLLKPFSLADVVAAAEKAQRRFVEKQAAANISSPAPDPETESETTDTSADQNLKEDDYIFVKNDSKLSRVKIADISLIEGMSEYVRIYTTTGTKPLMTLISMKKMEASLPPDTFMRVHRSWIVNLKKIDSIAHFRISIANQLVPISDNYKDKFIAYIESHAIK